jgi:meiotically up-regulated gene 157 (Mug157) protein
MVYVITTAMEGILRATGVRKNLHPRTISTTSKGLWSRQRPHYDHGQSTKGHGNAHSLLHSRYLQIWDRSLMPSQANLL